VKTLEEYLMGNRPLPEWETPSLFERIKRCERGRRRWGYSVLGLSLAVSACVAPGVYYGVVCAICLLPPLVCSVIVACIYVRKRESALHEWHARLDRVPLYLKRSAMQLYGFSGWQMAAIECHEAHVGGDCPLCGAE